MTKGVADQLGPLLVKAGTLLAPHHFPRALEGSPAVQQHEEPNTTAMVDPESEGNAESQTAAAGPDQEGVGTDSQAAGGESEGNTEDQEITTTTTDVTVEMAELEPEAAYLLMEKGKKLQHHKAIAQHAKMYLSELGTVDANKRYTVFSSGRIVVVL